MSKQNKIIVGTIVVILVGVLLAFQGSNLQTPPPPPTPPVGLVPIDGGVLGLLIGGLFLGIRKLLK